jgi:hypothetical protein
MGACNPFHGGSCPFARLHYGGYSMVRVRLKRPHQSAPKCVTAAAALATKADAANVRARPRLAGQCEKWLARPNTQRAIPAFARPPPSPCPHTRPYNCPHKRPPARPETWLARLHYGGCSTVRGRLQQPHLSAPKCKARRSELLPEARSQVPNNVQDASPATARAQRGPPSRAHMHMPLLAIMQPNLRTIRPSPHPRNPQGQKAEPRIATVAVTIRVY